MKTNDPTVSNHTVPAPMSGIEISDLVVRGIISGVVTLASLFLLGVVGMAAAGVACGFIVGYVSARSARSHVIIASIVGNLVAVGSVFAVALILTLPEQNRYSGPRDALVPLALLLGGIFLLPGLGGGLCVWGQRERARRRSTRGFEVIPIKQKEVR
jgi:hypothetical protein